MPRLSIIIVSFNTRSLLRECLRSIFDHSGGLDFEVIVVDNHSQDDSVEMVRNEFSGVKLLCNSMNLGFAAGCNAGIISSSGEYILLMNSDASLMPNTLSSTLHYMQQHRDVGSVGCKILNRNGQVQPSARDFPTIWNLLLETFFVYKILPHSGTLRNPWVTDYTQEQDVDIVKGAFFLTRRQTFADVGPMDERFFLYSEEQDWCLRAKRLGWRVVYWPYAEIYHHDGGSSEVKKNSSLYLIYDSQFKYFAKHHGIFYATIARLIMLAGIVLRLILWLLLGLAQSSLSIGPTNAPARLKYYWFALVWHFRKLC